MEMKCDQAEKGTNVVLLVRPKLFYILSSALMGQNINPEMK